MCVYDTRVLAVADSYFQVAGSFLRKKHTGTAVNKALLSCTVMAFTAKQVNLLDSLGALDSKIIITMTGRRRGIHDGEQEHT